MPQSSVISSKGQIVIPAAFRKKYKLKAGTQVVFREDQGHLILDADPYAAFRAFKGSIDAPLTQWLEEEREAERLREDAK